MTDSQASVCRLCGNLGLENFLSLGRTPLANALLTKEQLGEPEVTYPLDVAFCSRCFLVQITETVSPEKLFREYFYLSSFAETMLRHAESLAARLVQSRGLGEKSLVIEVASNDGYLLQHYKRAGIPVLGVEPATNVARVAEQNGIPTVCEFFGPELGERLFKEGHRADVLHASNVLAHVSDLDGFVRGISTILKEDGVVVVEVPYVKDMIDHCEFDTIYHEHLSYFSLTALTHLFKRHELSVIGVERLPIHGGTLRIYAGHQGATQTDPTANLNPSFHEKSAVEQLLDDEKSWVGDLSFYAGFRQRVENLRSELRRLLGDLKASGKRIAAYGASAKGSTLLNYCGIGPDMLEYVVDRSTVKQGFYTPGTHLLIHGPEKLLADLPDYVILLTWNFANEILEQQSEYRSRGGRFIIPVPCVEII